MREAHFSRESAGASQLGSNNTFQFSVPITGDRSPVLRVKQGEGVDLGEASELDAVEWAT